MTPLIDKLLWSGSSVAPAESTHDLQDEMLEEVHAAASLAFSNSAQQASRGSNPKEPAIYLYCPYNNANAVVDAAVKHLAFRHDADVVVLDAFELARGKYGALGTELGAVIGKLCEKTPPSYGNNKTVVDNTNDTTVVNNANETTVVDNANRAKVVAMPNDVAAMDRSSDAAAQNRPCDVSVKAKPLAIPVLYDIISIAPTSTTSSKRRIIYLRDFSKIIHVAVPLVANLLHAIRMHRFSHAVDTHDAGPLPNVPQPTTLVLGMDGTATYQTPSEGQYYDVDKSTRLRTGGALLRKALPTLSSTSYTLRDNEDKSHRLPLPALDRLSAAFYLPLITESWKRVENKVENAAAEKVVKELEAGAACICLLPKDHESDAFKEERQKALYEHSRAITNALVRLHLESRGAIFSGVDEPLATVLLPYEVLIDQEPRTTIIPATTPVRPIVDMKERLAEASTTAGSAFVDLLSYNNKYSSSLIRTIDNVVTIILGLLFQDGDVHANVTPEMVWRAYGIHTCNSVLRASITHPSPSPSSSTASPASTPTQDEIIANVKEADDLDKFEKCMLSCIVDVSHGPSTTFDDVCVAKEVIENLGTIIMLPLMYPAAFKTGILKTEAISGVLLYGPPGTGKTMLCRAVAYESGTRMLHIKPSDVLTKWIGESEKSIRAIFRLARRLAPCVIFVDEMEALLGMTKSDEHTWHRQMLTEFLQEMDGLQSQSENRDKGVIVVGATNRPFDLDPAVLRRLGSRMMVDLPGAQERLQILQHLLRDELVHPDVDLATIAERTQRYSGSDLKNLCVSVATTSLKETIGKISWSSHTRNSATTTTTTGDLEPPTLPSRIITATHFEHALANVPSSYSERVVEDLRHWHENHKGRQLVGGS